VEVILTILHEEGKFGVGGYIKVEVNAA